MKDFNKDNLNDSIRRKFSEAEIQPGNKVWERIEADLLKQDNRKMRRKAAFYRNVAAAVIFIALVSIYFNLQDFNFKTNQETAIAPIELDAESEQNFVGGNDVLLEKPQRNLSGSSRGDNANESDGSALLLASSDNEGGVEDIESVVVMQDENLEVATIDEDFSTSMAKMDNKSPDGIELPQLEMKIKKVSYFAVSDLDKPKEKSNLAWNTNVNIGSGSFNPNSEITETPVFSTVSTLNNPGTNARTTGDDASINYSNQERKAVEELSSSPMQGSISFTFGLNFGVVLNERWNIKSGLQYGAYRSSSSSSTVLRDRNSDELFPYHGASSSTEISDGRVINTISEYELYNDFQIVTVPLMLSYKVIDRKFDVSMVGGISADFIVKNTLKGGSDQINEIKFHQSDKQSYRNLFASSMAGIEVSYPFADQYSVSIMPTYKKALSNITTDEATFNSKPAFLGLNMSLAYMF